MGKTRRRRRVGGEGTEMQPAARHGDPPVPLRDYSYRQPPSTSRQSARARVVCEVPWLASHRPENPAARSSTSAPEHVLSPSLPNESPLSTPLFGRGCHRASRNSIHAPSNAVKSFPPPYSPVPPSWLLECACHSCPSRPSRHRLVSLVHDSMC